MHNRLDHGCIWHWRIGYSIAQSSVLLATVLWFGADPADPLYIYANQDPDLDQALPTKKLFFYMYSYS